MNKTDEKYEKLYFNNAKLYNDFIKLREINTSLLMKFHKCGIKPNEIVLTEGDKDKFRDDPDFTSEKSDDEATINVDESLTQNIPSYLTTECHVTVNINELQNPLATRL
jgi:hypothetical protein